jgi:hypothetical protein
MAEAADVPDGAEKPSVLIIGGLGKHSDHGYHSFTTSQFAVHSFSSFTLHTSLINMRRYLVLALTNQSKVISVVFLQNISTSTPSAAASASSTKFCLNWPI